MATDFTITDCGSIVALRPNTEAAQDWVAEHIPADAQWFAGAVAVEPRYMQPILEGIFEAGLSA